LVLCDPTLLILLILRSLMPTVVLSVRARIFSENFENVLRLIAFDSFSVEPFSFAVIARTARPFERNLMDEACFNEQGAEAYDNAVSTRPAKLMGCA
jgi:hypothetical protein